MFTFKEKLTSLNFFTSKTNLLCYLQNSKNREKIPPK